MSEICLYSKNGESCGEPVMTQARCYDHVISCPFCVEVHVDRIIGPGDGVYGDTITHEPCGAQGCEDAFTSPGDAALFRSRSEVTCTDCLAFMQHAVAHIPLAAVLPEEVEP